MASIKKLDDRKYFVRVSQGRGANRQYINKTIRGTLKDAQAFAREQETKLDLGQTPLEIKLTFKKHVTDWLSHIRPTISPVTYNDYERTIKYYAADDLDSLKLSEIEPQQIQSIYDGLLGRGLSPETVWHVHRVLRACFNFAVEKERLRKTHRRAEVHQQDL